MAKMGYSYYGLRVGIWTRSHRRADSLQYDDAWIRDPANPYAFTLTPLRSKQRTASR